MKVKIWSTDVKVNVSMVFKVCQEIIIDNGEITQIRNSCINQEPFWFSQTRPIMMN